MVFFRKNVFFNFFFNITFSRVGKTLFSTKSSEKKGPFFSNDFFQKKLEKHFFHTHFRHITSSENWKNGFETPHCDNTAAGHPSRTPSDFANFFPNHNGSHNVQRRTTRFSPKIGKNENGKNAVFPKKNQHITSSLIALSIFPSFPSLLFERARQRHIMWILP